MAGPTSALDGLEGFVNGVRKEFEGMLGHLVEMPTVSADPEARAQVRKGAELAAQYLRAFGAHAEIVETPGNPVVLGKLTTATGNPTVTIYNHLDVQPAQEPEWTRDPFAFAVEDGRYLGRGSTDDKGPALSALFAARYAVENGVPINVQFLWELEEEIGSPSFDDFVAGMGTALKTDSVLVSDTVWISREVPAVPYALRGMQAARLLLETGERDAHSGLTGGAARNPVGELCQVIDRCYDAATGEVKIPGFYDKVVDVTDEEMRSFLSSGFAVEEFKRGHGLRSLRTQDPGEVIRRIWCLPTFEVHGITGGYGGPGVKTVVPPRAEAKVSMRLVPDQDAEAVFGLLEKFVREINPDIQVESAGSLQPYVGQLSGPYAEAASSAIRSAFGKAPAFIREGGSIGAVVTMQKRLGVPIMFLGLSLPEHGYHAPNEYFDWGQASGGMKAIATYLDEVSRIEG